MRKFEISPTVIAALRNRALAAPFREVGVPLYLPAYDPRAMQARIEIDAEDARIDAGGVTIDSDEDDDFY